MKDSRCRKRKLIANLEESRMIESYEEQCKYLGERLETPVEKEKRIKRREQEKRHKDRYWIK